MKQPVCNNCRPVILLTLSQKGILMSKQIQFRRGTASEHTTFTGAIGEITMDTTAKTLRLHDGGTPGGIPLAKHDGSNVNTAAFLTNLGFGTQNMQCPGYYKLPNGLILQWGEDETSGTKFFPIVFPNAALSASIAPTMIGGVNWYGQNFSIKSSSQYIVTLVNCSKINWFAIGY